MWLLRLRDGIGVDGEIVPVYPRSTEGALPVTDRRRPRHHVIEQSKSAQRIKTTMKIILQEVRLTFNTARAAVGL